MPTCPICRTECARHPENPHAPFCSKRCRMADLGSWLNEDYRVPSETESMPLDGGENEALS
ncbi:MAG: DNA gyrase inhibitor YacG [Sandaracinaceae bacterium]